tara:strand:- start:431 stop:1465 length:1035 start_codon:yes stop_codon:yes gene_type:complete
MNLEGAITKRDVTKKRGVSLRVDDTYLKEIHKRMPSVVGLNNNHVFDFGVSGLLDTMNHLDKNGIPFFGAGTNINEACKPYITNNDVGILGVSNPEPSGPKATKNKPGIVSIYNAKSDIVKLSKKVKCTIVSAHAGTEFYKFPSPNIKKYYQKYIDWGADIVIGNHPHVPQGYENYKGKHIFYSLGNFVFNLEYHKKYNDTDKSLLVLVDINSTINIDVMPTIRKGKMIDIHEDYLPIFETLNNKLKVDYKKSWADQSFDYWFGRYSSIDPSLKIRKTTLPHLDKKNECGGNDNVIKKYQSLNKLVSLVKILIECRYKHKRVSIIPALIKLGCFFIIKLKGLKK